MGVAQFCVAIGLANEANLETWFISERLRDGSHVFLEGRLLNALMSVCYLYTSVVFSC
jgi:hypothetical protein